MIRFRCPSCKSILEAAPKKAGEKVACLKCGQRLQIPSPPNKTVLGEALPASSPMPATTQLRAGATPALGNCRACGSPFSKTDEVGGGWVKCPRCSVLSMPTLQQQLAAPITGSPAKKPKGKYLPWAVFVALAVLLAISGLWAGVWLLSRVASQTSVPPTDGGRATDTTGAATEGPQRALPRVSEKQEGETWSHADLMKYLTEAGVKFSIYEGRPTLLHLIDDGGPAMLWFPGKGKVSLDALQSEEATYPMGWGNSVYVQKLPSIQEAKDSAGVLGDKGFSWGRFFFSRTDGLEHEAKELLNEIRTCLK